MRKTEYREIEPFTTKDGSRVRELMHPRVHGNAAQSLAEAIVAPGGTTLTHVHYHSEELYHVTQGRGRMVLGEESAAIAVGDTVCIPPGTAHRIENIGSEPLKILCCCAPAYSHEDTKLV